MTAYTREDTPVAIEGDGVEVRLQDAGDMTLAFIHFPAGTDMSPALKGLQDDLCQCPHYGYVLNGRIRMHTSGDDEYYEAGQAYYWAPGHAPEAVEDVDIVEFSPSAEFRAVMDHIQSQMG